MKNHIWRISRHVLKFIRRHTSIIQKCRESPTYFPNRTFWYLVTLHGWLNSNSLRFKLFLHLSLRFTILYIWFSIICRSQPFNVDILIASSYTHPHFDYFNHVLFNLPSTKVLPIHNIKSLSNYLLFTNGIQSLKFRNSLNLGS